MIPSENTFANLIGIEGAQWHYHIPRFQREYVWQKNNWSKLLEDIYDNDPGHYMGSVICVHDSSELSPSSELIYEVVDGQQRLTTLSILLAAVYSKLTKEAIKGKAHLKQDPNYIIKTIGISQRLVKRVDIKGKQLPWGFFKAGKETYCLRVQPSTQDNNLEDYQYLLSEVGLISQARYIHGYGKRRIYRTFSFFHKNIPDELDKLYDLLDRIYRLSFIHISEASQSKAFLLFETLNYRGVPLSAIDIIKNKMLATLESKHGLKIDDAYDQWQELLDNLPEDRDQDRFLRQFYNAFKFNPSIKIEKITRATGSNIISVYENLIKRDARLIFDQLQEKAEHYHQLIEPEDYIKQKAGASLNLIDLERISAAPSYTFLLYLFSLDKNDFVEADLRDKVVELMCKYYFRRNVTDYPGTRDLDAISIDLVEQCQKEIAKGGKLSYSFISKKVLTGRGKPSSLKSMRESLEDNLFAANDYMARYALAKLDETSHTREYAPDLWARNEKGQLVWTVEHVFPKGRNIPKDWVNMIANGDYNKAKEIQDEWVHCLGNLTLSGYNSKLSNLAFEKKQTKTGANIIGNRLQLGYKNGLALNNIEFPFRGKNFSLATAQEWKKEHIKARNDVLVEMLVKLFKFENE